MERSFDFQKFNSNEFKLVFEALDSMNKMKLKAEAEAADVAKNKLKAGLMLNSPSAITQNAFITQDQSAEGLAMGKRKASQMDSPVPNFNKMNSVSGNKSKMSEASIH